MKLKKGEYLNKIICGDVIETLKKLPDKSVDLVVTAPPYNFPTSLGKHYAPKAYIKWQRSCLKELMRIIKEDGAIFYTQAWSLDKKRLLDDRHAIIKGFPVRQIIAWKEVDGKPFPSPYFNRVHEIIYLIAKDKFKLLPAAQKYGDFWEYRQEKNLHPNPFPIALVERIIASTKAKVVLDPFCGSGTTAKAAKKLKRNYIGIELFEEFAEMARKSVNGKKPIR